MEYERKQTGEKILHTQTTRASIVELIVNNPEKLNSIPALSIISRLSVDKSDLLSQDERKEIYQRYLAKDDHHDKYLQKQKAWYEKNKDVLKEKAKIRSRIAYAKKKEAMMASQSVKV